MDDPLDSDRILAALQPAARARMAWLEVVAQVESTNRELLRRPLPGRGLAGVLLADSQTAGRGRRGRSWSSPPGGNLYLSLLRGFDGGLERLEGLSLAAGIAVAGALHALGYPEVRLKWPNDLVVADPGGDLLKVGGLLVEGGSGDAGRTRAVIGLGLNVRMPDAAGGAIGQPWTDLSALSGRAPARWEIAAGVIACCLDAFDTLEREGFTAFLSRFPDLDVLQGRSIELHLEHGVVHGTALGIGADGALRVRLGDGSERSFHSGEASVRRSPA